MGDFEETDIDVIRRLLASLPVVFVIFVALLVCDRLEIRRCPACGRRIAKRVTKCSHCGESIIFIG